MGLGILPPPGVAPPKAPDVQDFISSGTWTKPAGAKWVLYEGIGAGGASGLGGFLGIPGSGGSRVCALIPAASLAATESVTVGAAGVPSSASGSANAGGASVFAGLSTGVSQYAYPSGQSGPVGISDGGWGGNGKNASYRDSASSVFGGGAGSTQYSAAGTGGTGGAFGMLVGGNGGDGSSVAAGTPGGAGGTNGTTSQAGARGQVRITTYF